MSRKSRLLPALLAIAIALPIAAHAAALPTTTTLTLSSQAVSWHTPVKLTAQVTFTTGGGPVTGGTITFCDLSGPYTRCEDSAIVGTVQVTAAGGQINVIPAITVTGPHKYTAIFSGTSAAAQSTSTAQTLNVTGLYPTTTSISATGNPSGYQLTATVVGYANQPPTLSGKADAEQAHVDYCGSARRARAAAECRGRATRFPHPQKRARRNRPCDKTGDCRD